MIISLIDNHSQASWAVELVQENDRGLQILNDLIQCISDYMNILMTCNKSRLLQVTSMNVFIWNFVKMKYIVAVQYLGRMQYIGIFHHSVI